MPLNLAVFAPSKAKGVIKENRDIDTWIIAGHSLGGSMACKFAYDNPDLIKGIVLFASYPAGSNDLSDSNIKVLSMYGTNDGFVGSDKIEKYKKLLPKDTIYKPIYGGNHSQMAYYGFQKGDNEAKISREEQQSEIIKDIIEFIDGIKK
jgi:dienelactone hydrolase